MDESDRLAFLERRQAATHRMFVESRAWVVRLAALHQPQYNPRFLALAPRHTPCAPLQEYVGLGRGAHAAERQARVTAMSKTQRAARLVADPNADRHIPERPDEERCRRAHMRVRPPPSAAVESLCHPPLSPGGVLTLTLALGLVTAGLVTAGLKAKLCAARCAQYGQSNGAPRSRL